MKTAVAMDNDAAPAASAPPGWHARLAAWVNIIQAGGAGRDRPVNTLE